MNTKARYSVVWIGDAPGGNYVRKQLDLIGGGPWPEVSVVSIRHDHWCGYFDGSPCDCDPDITMRPITGAHAAAMT